METDNINAEYSASPDFKIVQQSEIHFSVDKKEYEIIDEIETEEYAGIGKAELIKKLEEILAGDTRVLGKLNVKNIRDHYNQLTKEEIDHQHKEFINEGEKEEDFFIVRNPLDDKFENLFKKLFQQKTQQKKQQEKSLGGTGSCYSYSLHTEQFFYHCCQHPCLPDAKPNRRNRDYCDFFNEENISASGC